MKFELADKMLSIKVNNNIVCSVIGIAEIYLGC